MNKFVFGIIGLIFLVVLYGATLGGWSIQIERDASPDSASLRSQSDTKQSSPTATNIRQNRADAANSSMNAAVSSDSVSDQGDTQGASEPGNDDSSVNFLTHADFSVAADQYIFMTASMGDESAVNYDSKDFIHAALNDYLVEHNLSSLVHMEYNECNTHSCLVSIQVRAQELSTEAFHALTSEALFGAMGTVSSSGGEYAVVEEGDVKYLRLHYHLGG